MHTQQITACSLRRPRPRPSPAPTCASTLSETLSLWRLTARPGGAGGHRRQTWRRHAQQTLKPCWGGWLQRMRALMLASAGSKLQCCCRPPAERAHACLWLGPTLPAAALLWTLPPSLIHCTMDLAMALLLSHYSLFFAYGTWHQRKSRHKALQLLVFECAFEEGRSVDAVAKW